jgi:hypothetical protein
MTKKEKFTKRMFEIIPGLLAWIVITSPLWGGILFPEVISIFVLVFNAFWLYKSLSVVILFLTGYIKLRNGENAEWMGKLKRLSDPKRGIEELKKESADIQKLEFSKDRFKESPFAKIPSILQRVLFIGEKRKLLRHFSREIKLLEKINGQEFLDWKKLHHIIIIPYWKEPYAVLKRSLDKLANQTFPKKQISVVLGAEARHPPAFEMAKRLQKEYKDDFEHVWINNHELSGDDIVGKSANMSSAGKHALQKIEELGWDKKYVTVTSCDCDTQFNPQYFAYFSYLFISDEYRYERFFASPMMYYANIWKIPFYSRVANTVFTINNIATSVRSDKFIQVSSYSFSWKLLEDIDFWSVDVIPEDFHMFFKALFKHGDSVMTKTIFLQNYADAAEAIGHVSTIKNQYEQVKRWAWGVSDHRWMIQSYLKSKRKSFYVFYRMAHTIFDHLTWSMISFILLFGANIPTLVNKNFSQTVFGQKLPKVSSFILTVSSISFVITVLIDFFMKPRRKEKISIIKWLFEQLQWFTFPFISFFFGAIPGLDAQTRLLFGKYLEYRLTEKH